MRQYGRGSFDAEGLLISKLEPFRGSRVCTLANPRIGLIMRNADTYRRKAQHFLTLARTVCRAEDRAALTRMAAYWKERADEAEQAERIVQLQQQAQSDAALSHGRED
jgi:hypothetical protein